MAYYLKISERDEKYLDNLPLSSYAKRSIDDFIEYGIADVSDGDRLRPTSRYGGSVFKIDFHLCDVWGDERYHEVVFLVDDSQAEVGILAIVFVDHRVGEIPS